MQRNAASSLGESLIAKVMRTVQQRIAARSLTPGSRLPSIRSFALSMKVSKSTVVEAYERLQAEGLIRSRPGSGFYVAAPLAPLTLAEIGPPVDRAVDPLWISRQALEPGGGRAPARLRLAAAVLDAGGRIATRLARHCPREQRDAR